MNRSLTNLWPFLFFTAAMFLLYCRSFGYDWAMDDYMVIVNNPDIRSLPEFFNDSYPGRPLREVTYLVDHAVWGLKPSGWHFQQILWHALNGCLLFVLVKRLLPGRLPALFAALFFLVHPVNVEVVANLSHRKDSLALCFALLSTLCFLNSYADSVSRRRRIANLLAAGVLLGVAMLAKQTAIGLLAVWVAWDFCTPDKARRWLPLHERWHGLLPAAAGLTVAGALTYAWSRPQFYQAILPVLLKGGQFTQEASLDLYLRMIAKAFPFLFAKLVWPVGLSMEYSFTAAESWLSWWSLASLGLGLLAVGLLFWGWRSGRAGLVLAVVWMVAFWLPASNLLWPFSYFAADRYLYMPMAGFAIILAMALQPLLERCRLPVLTSAALLIIVLASLTWRQADYWQNDLTLSQRILEVSPGSTAGLKGVGIAHLKRGALNLAIQHFQKASMNFDDSEPFYLLGKAYEKSGDRINTKRNYLRFVSLNDPRYPEKNAEVAKLLSRF